MAQGVTSKKDEVILFLYETFQITELNGSVENVKAEQKRWKYVNKQYYFNLYYKKFRLSFN